MVRLLQAERKATVIIITEERNEDEYLVFLLVAVPVPLLSAKYRKQRQ